MDEIDEEILAPTVSDEALEPAAGTERGGSFNARSVRARRLLLAAADR
jgi:hypothetical protein